MSSRVNSSARPLTHPSLRALLRSPLVLVGVVFILALWPRILDLGVFVGPDEFYWLEGSAKFTQALADGNLAQTYHAGQPGVTLMWLETLGSWLAYGWAWLSGSADWPAAVGATEDMTNLAAKRLVVGIANALLVALSVLLVCRLFGEPTAWLVGFLLAFDPFLLTESRALRTEGLLTGLATLALLGLLWYQAEPNGRKLVGCGVLLGLAFLSKVPAVSLLPVGFVLIGAVLFLKPGLTAGQRWRQVVRGWLVWLGVAAITVWLLWPALWVGPLEVARQMYDFLNIRVVEGEGGGKSFFLGQTYLKDNPGLLFYPVVLLYRSSPILWLGLILLLVTWPTRWLPRAYKIAVGAILLYLLPYLLLITLSELKFDRYVIPMLPAITIMAALGLVAGWRWLTTSPGQTPAPPTSALPNTEANIPISLLTRSPNARLFWAAALLVLGGQMALALPHHPYYYTYWNPLLGGIQRAVQILPVGIAGEGLDVAAARLNTFPGVENLRVASANSQKIRPIYRGKTIPLDNVDGRWVQSDYTLIYISQWQRGKHDPNILDYLSRRPPVFTVTLHGLDYAWLYPGPAAQYYGGGYQLEGRGTLFGYSLTSCALPCSPVPEAVEIAAGDTLPVTLVWRNEGQQETDRFFVRLMDVDQYVWAEAIAQPRRGFEGAHQTREAIVESEANLSLPVGMPPGDYFLKPGFRTLAGELIGYFELPADAPIIHVTQATTYPSHFQPPQPASLVVNDELRLLGFKLEPAQTTPGAPLWATLYWQATQTIRHDYVILLRLLAEDGQELAYWLGRPVRSGYPTTGWQQGQLVQDPWLLQIPAAANPGLYQFEVALFDAASEAEVARQIVGSLEVAPGQ